ncbi:MAG TPA: hypothetical protein VKN99_19630 [Polyangia bacterium]|nr:hypothetical protein [Polyangia bacterium]
MGVAAALVLATLLGGAGGIENRLHFLDDAGQRFQLRPPALDLTPVSPALIFDIRPQLHPTEEGIPPIQGIPMNDKVATTIIVVGGAALLTSIVLDWLHHK